VGKLIGEAQNADLNVINNLLYKVWPKLNEKYFPNNIFHADETSIFYKMTPNKISKFKEEKCVGGKLSKEHITAIQSLVITIWLTDEEIINSMTKGMEKQKEDEE